MQLILLIILLLPLSFSHTQDTFHLLQAKHALTDPSNSLSSWAPHSGPTHCNWAGVTCQPNSTSVISLHLSSLNLVGPFPLSLCHLTSLTYLSLSDNFINSSLPSDISTCRNLIHLNLSQNYLVGHLPPSLSALPKIRTLDLSNNNFSGDIPPTFGSFQKLEAISLVSNLLDGDFPTVFANVSTLRELNVSDNPFRPSRLSPEFGNLTNLRVLWASQCNLIGEIPDSLSRLGNLVDIDLSENQLYGAFPSWISELTSIVQIELYGNLLTDELPSTGWRNLTELRQLDASMNKIKGSIPDELTRLPLTVLSLFENELTGEIPVSIAESSNLQELKLFSNMLTGELPRKLGVNSPLRLIDVCNNFLTGEIPQSLCSNGVLEEILMFNNSFSGHILEKLSECKTLTRVRLKSNRLSGSVPVGLWGLPRLSLLELNFNSLSGSVSELIASAVSLSELIISDNNFTGEIPKEVGVLSSLVSFDGSNNRFIGSLPSSIVDLGQLANLDLHNNQLSGEIPSGINSLKRLNDLNLANNGLSGRIPSEIGLLSSLNYLDLSLNRLSGDVPDELQNLKLNELNLSYNQLTGNVPSLYSNPIYQDSFLGNPGLCSDISDHCGRTTKAKSHGYIWVMNLFFALAAVVFIVGVAWFCFKYNNFKKTNRSFDNQSRWTLMSFHKLGFNESDILNSLDEDNVIGKGGSGKVYKAILSNGEVVAVKKLWNSSNRPANVGNRVEDDGFETEVETLGRIRHKNIVRLWCCCKGRDSKLLVYEYMPNGSLGDLLHGGLKGGLLLDWPTRYRIGMDAAEGMSYLHHDCVPPIVHRDVKSNNILLDSDFGAKVADFGVAKVVENAGRGIESMSVIAGSCGYIAPEYAYTLRVNEKSDTYSFGVVILELVTGRRPIDPEYGEKDLVKWVCTTMDQKGADQVLDPMMSPCFKEDMLKVLKIGLLCTSPLPINRPSMRRVVKMLRQVTDESLSKIGQKDGRLTPYYYDDGSDHGSVV